MPVTVPVAMEGRFERGHGKDGPAMPGINVGERQNIAEVAASHVAAKQARAATLSEELARPGVWDDPANGQRLTTELSRLNVDLERYASSPARSATSPPPTSCSSWRRTPSSSRS